MQDEPYTYYGLIDLARHDTTPGAVGPLAPPTGWQGDDNAYLALIRQRYRGDIGVRQHLAFAARIIRGGNRVVVTGPFRAAALYVLDKL